jgi:signal peptidase
MTALRLARRALDAILLVALAAVALTAGVALLGPATGGRALVIGGGSMEPAIPKGSLILAAPGNDYRVGDVVAVQPGSSTPYTHRVTRLAELDGVSYVETKGDANDGPDPALVPVSSIIGRVDLALPLLGYLGVLLGSTAGLVGFLAVGGSLLLASGALEEWESGRCEVCAAPGAAPAADEAVDPAAAVSGEPGVLTGGGAVLAPVGVAATAHLAALSPPAPRAQVSRFVARVPAQTRVRETGIARDPRSPVLLERDRRNPRRHGMVTVPQVGHAGSAAPSLGTGVPAARSAAFAIAADRAA